MVTKPEGSQKIAVADAAGKQIPSVADAAGAPRQGAADAADAPRQGAADAADAPRQAIADAATFALRIRDGGLRDYSAVAVRAVGSAAAGNLSWRYLLADFNDLSKSTPLQLQQGPTPAAHLNRCAEVIEIVPLQLAGYAVPPTTHCTLVPAMFAPLWSLVKLAQRRVTGTGSRTRFQEQARQEAFRLLHKVCGVAKPTKRAVAEIAEAAEWAGIDRALHLMEVETLKTERSDLSDRHADFQAWRNLRPDQVGIAGFDEVIEAIEKHAGNKARRALLAPRQCKHERDWLEEWEARTAAETGCSQAEATASVAPRVHWLLCVPDEDDPARVYPVQSFVMGIADAADRAHAAGAMLAAEQGGLEKIKGKGGRKKRRKPKYTLEGTPSAKQRNLFQKLSEDWKSTHHVGRLDYDSFMEKHGANLLVVGIGTADDARWCAENLREHKRK